MQGVYMSEIKQEEALGLFTPPKMVYQGQSLRGGAVILRFIAQLYAEELDSYYPDPEGRVNADSLL